MMTLLSVGEIKRICTDQNPRLVQQLITAGTLTVRLAEALEMAGLVQGDAIARSMSPAQARELAVDAVSLAWTGD